MGKKPTPTDLAGHSADRTALRHPGRQQALLFEAAQRALSAIHCYKSSSWITIGQFCSANSAAITSA